MVKISNSDAMVGETVHIRINVEGLRPYLDECGEVLTLSINTTPQRILVEMLADRLIP